MTSDIIGTAMAGETVTATTKVGRGRQAVEVKVTRTAPEAKVVDEVTQEERESWSSQLPVDSGKRTVEVLPGIKLVMYSRGYVCLRLKGKGWDGRKTELGKPLYRDEVKVLVEALLAEVEGLTTYDEANGTAPF